MSDMMETVVKYGLSGCFYSEGDCVSGGAAVTH